MSEPYSSDDDACACNEEGAIRSLHKRKEIHNEVERRRKDKINVGILRLGALLPDKDPKKQSKNGILEQAFNYITYLKSLNEKLVTDKVSDVEATVFAGLRKQIRELEELNANYVKLLTVAGIPLTSGPEEIWVHAPRKYTLKHSPEKQRALLSYAEAKGLTGPCRHHGEPPAVTGATGHVCASVEVTTTASTVTACSVGAVATTVAACTPNSMLVTQALPSAPVMSTAQPPAVTMLQQQSLVAPATAGSVVSQPILVLNDQGLPMLQNVVTFQNTSIILNPQGTMTRTPVSAVSFPGSEVLPVQVANPLTEDISHHHVSAQPTLGGIVHCDPTKTKETRLCGVPGPVQGTAFLPGAGVVMNQPMLSFGGGAVLTGQGAPPAMGQAFLLPSGQIIPVVTQAPVMAANPLAHQNATSIHAANAISCVSACATSNAFVSGLGKVSGTHDSSAVSASRSCSMTCQEQIRCSSVSSAVSACSPIIVPAGSPIQVSSKSQSVPSSQSVLLAKPGMALDHARTKISCVHTTSKQPLCSIRPKPPQPVPDSSQNKPACLRKGCKKPLRQVPETASKKPRLSEAAVRAESEVTSHGLSLSTSATPQTSESVSSTSNTSGGTGSMGSSPLATDILAQATESIFSGSITDLPLSSSSSAARTEPCCTDNKADTSQSTVSKPDSQGDLSSSTVHSYGSAKMQTEQKDTSCSLQLSEACTSPGVVSNSGQPQVHSNVQGSPRQDSGFSHATEPMATAGSARASQSRDERSVLKAVDTSVQEAEATGSRQQRELSAASLHSIVMEENIDISPSVSSTTFTESYVSASNSLSESITKMSDCTTSILCQLTPPSSKNSDDGNGKAFVSSTDSLASESELPLILSIPDDDGHTSLNSNSNPGLSFPPLSPGDQLEQELGNGSKMAENPNNLPSFSLTPPITPVVVTTVPSPVVQNQDPTPITIAASRGNDSTGSTFPGTCTHSATDAFSGVRNQVSAVQATNGGRKQQQQQQGCQHNPGTLQMQGLSSSKQPIDTYCHNSNFISSTPPMTPSQGRGPHFSIAPCTTLSGFGAEFIPPKGPDPSLHCSKPPPSPCRMTRDVVRSVTPNKTQESEFVPPLNPYAGTTSFPCSYPLVSRGNLSSSAQNHSALSSYSAEALIGSPAAQPQSLYHVSSACTHSSGMVQMLTCHQSSRAHISYSAESLIQSQPSNTKKDSASSSKETSLSSTFAMGSRQTSYQQLFSQQNAYIHHSHSAASGPRSNRQPNPSPVPSTVSSESRQHALRPPTSCTTVNTPYHTVVSAAQQRNHQASPGPMSRTTSTENRPHSLRTPSSSCAAAVNTNYHSAVSTAQPSQRPNPSPAPCAVSSEGRPHVLHAPPSSSCVAMSSTYHVTQTQRNLAGTPVRYQPQQYKEVGTHQAPCSSHVTQHTGHSAQQSMEKSPAPGMMPQSYPYPNFTAGPQSPACFGPYPPPSTSVGRMNSSCLQTSACQSSFGSQAPTTTGQHHQQQGCLFPGTAGSPIISLPPDLGSQCSGAPPPPPVFSTLPQHCSQPPHIVNNLIPTPFSVASGPAGNAVLAPVLGEVEKRRDKIVTDGGHCPDAEKGGQSKSKSKKGRSSSSVVPAAPAYFPEFSRRESHLQPSPLTAVSPAVQKSPHPAPPSWQQGKPSPHCISDAECGPNSLAAGHGSLFRPQSQNSININFHAPGPPPPPLSVNHHHHHQHHSPTQRGLQVAPNPMPSSVTQSHRTNCAVAPSHHVPNFNLSNIFPDIGAGPNDAVISLGAPVKLQLQQEHGAGQQARGSSAHFYPSGRVLHNSFNPILPPHNNFGPPGHHAPSFSNVIPPLSFPMHEH